MTSDLLLDPPNERHIAILYEDSAKLYPAIAKYLNEGLKRGQLCIYATVYYRDEGHLEKLSALIPNYAENLEKGNLLVVDLAPFYISALMGNMKPFEEAKQLFAAKAKDRTDKHVRFVGDGTGFLFRHGHFDECAMVEEWWHSKPFEGSYACPFEKQFFSGFPHEIHSHRAIVANHDAIVDADSLPDQNLLDQMNDQQQLPLSLSTHGYDETSPGHGGEMI